MKAAYIYSLHRTSTYLATPLPNTGLPPHFAVAVDKSTPIRDTNQAIMLLMPFEGKRIAMPIDAPKVYGYSDEEHAITGGTGRDLADQIYGVLRNKLDLNQEQFHFLRGILSLILSS